MFETVKTNVFTRSVFFDAKPPEIDFVMILGSILETFYEPGLLTFCFLVAPVANPGIFFESRVAS